MGEHRLWIGSDPSSDARRAGRSFLPARAPTRHEGKDVRKWVWQWLQRIGSGQIDKSRMSVAWLREYERKPTTT
jgi:hypothetical protein